LIHIEHFVGRCVFYPSKSPDTCLDKDDDGNCARGQFTIQRRTSIKVRCKTGYTLYVSNKVVKGEGTITCNKGHYPNFRCPAGKMQNYKQFDYHGYLR
jgi:hypothetical protein